MKNARLLVLVVIFLAVVAAGCISKSSQSGTSTSQNQINQTPTTRPVQLYYYDSSKDQDLTGNVMCTRNGLVAVERKMPSTITPIQDAINLLLQGKLTAGEKAQGITTEYPLPGVALKGASLKDGTLTLEFSDPQNKTSGGSCRSGVLWYQIEATAKQFPEVKTVKFTPETIFQP